MCLCSNTFLQGAQPPGKLKCFHPDTFHKQRKQKPNERIK